MLHAVTTTCLHCKYSFELQRKQAGDPRVVHAMTLASAVEDFFFELQRGQAEEPRVVTCLQCKFVLQLQR